MNKVRFNSTLWCEDTRTQAQSWYFSNPEAGAPSALMWWKSGKRRAEKVKERAEGQAEVGGGPHRETGKEQKREEWKASSWAEGKPVRERNREGGREVERRPQRDWGGWGEGERKI